MATLQDYLASWAGRYQRVDVGRRRGRHRRRRHRRSPTSSRVRRSDAAAHRDDNGAGDQQTTVDVIADDHVHAALDGLPIAAPGNEERSAPVAINAGGVVSPSATGPAGRLIEPRDQSVGRHHLRRPAGRDRG